MDKFDVGTQIENYRLPVPVRGVVLDAKIDERCIGSQWVRRVTVKVGDDICQWRVENVRPVIPAPALQPSIAPALQPA
jgi:hypothetical protein